VWSGNGSGRDSWSENKKFFSHLDELDDVNGVRMNAVGGTGGQALRYYPPSLELKSGNESLVSSPRVVDNLALKA
jgi:hypothetical protein